MMKAKLTEQPFPWRFEDNVMIWWDSLCVNMSNILGVTSQKWAQKYPMSWDGVYWSHCFSSRRVVRR